MNWRVSRGQFLNEAEGERGVLTNITPMVMLRASKGVVCLV